jgi:hypothetical protein
MTIAQAVTWLREELGVGRDRKALWNWINYGVDGVKLEAVVVGQVWMTSSQALERFFEALTRARGHAAGVKPLKLSRYEG